MAAVIMASQKGVTRKLNLPLEVGFSGQKWEGLCCDIRLQNNIADLLVSLRVIGQ